MSAAPLSYQALRQQLRTEVVRHELASGQGGPLLFVWAVGVAFFWLQDLPPYLVIWTVAVAGLAGLAVRDALRRPVAFAEVARLLAQQQFRIEALGEQRHRDAVAKAAGLFGELVAKVEEIRLSRGADGEANDDLLDVVPRAHALLALQHESARQAEEFQRVLRLIGGQQHHGYGNRLVGAVSQELPAPNEPGSLRAANFDAVEREAVQADELVTRIGQQIETLMLQVLQMERRTVDLVIEADARRESAEAMERLQDMVDARREAASGFVALLGSDKERV